MKKYLNYLLKGAILLKAWRVKTHLCPKVTLLFGILVFTGCVWSAKAQESKLNMKVGAYYFDGWAGQNRKANDPNESWAKNAPSHLTRRMVEEFPNREPVWGWRDDDLSIMEQQIDLAANNGIEFFLFCWYWRDSNGPINPEAIECLSLHTSLNLYMKAKNKNRIKFSFLVANHGGSEIKGPESWGKATEFWMQYLKDPQYLSIGGRPFIVIFNTQGIDEDGLNRMQNVSKKAGLSGLSIAGCGNTGNKGFTYRTHYNIVPGYAAGSEEHKYAELVDATQEQWAGTEVQPYIPEITVGWDKHPWENPTGLNQKQVLYYLLCNSESRHHKQVPYYFALG